MNAPGVFYPVRESSHAPGVISYNFFCLLNKIDFLRMKGGEKSMATKKAPAKKAKKTTKKK